MPIADTHGCTYHPREPVQITGGSGPDPLAREVGAAKVKDMHRDAVRQTFVPPEKELPVERERERLPENSSTGLQLKRDKAGSSWQAHTNGVGVDGDDAVDDGQQPWVVLVAEDELFSIEAKREELKKSRFARVEACCKVRKNGDMCRRGVNMIIFSAHALMSPIKGTQYMLFRWMEYPLYGESCSSCSLILTTR